MSPLMKYPKTPHLPNSEAYTADDVVLNEFPYFTNKPVVATLKMDGECTSMYGGYNYIHARSLEPLGRHTSHSWIKTLYANIYPYIPNGWRICGENLYAKHSIEYRHLESYFYVFSIWYHDVCLSWNNTIKFCKQFGLTTVPMIYYGIFDSKEIHKNYPKVYNGDLTEGYVVRQSGEFEYKDFQNCVAKYVRKNHVQTTTHWKNQQVIPNKIELKAKGFRYDTYR